MDNVWETRYKRDGVENSQDEHDTLIHKKEKSVKGWHNGC